MKLYKFRSLSNFTRVQEIVETNTFYMANWRELNDPMEGYFHYILDQTQISFKDRLQQFIDNKSNLRICSFSNTYHPILMWSHYADEHKGIAIELELKSKNYSNLYRVKYSKTIPLLDLTINEPIDILKNKIKFWSYEREWRFIDTRNMVRVPQITAIYFGVRTDDNLKSELKRILEPQPIIFYETKIDFASNRIVRV